MALERQDIQRRDFPVARRGYDRDAVDAHLRAVADEVDEARRQPRASSAPLASAASEQVRAIVEAAETQATEIRTAAEDEARETRAGARTEGQSHVARVEEAATLMLQRVEALESELGALVETLRTDATRLTADLGLLRENMGELSTAAAGPQAAPEAAPEEADDGKGPAVEAPPEAEADAEAEADDATTADDSEGARLIALNMALNGTPREETDRYLEENFQLEDRGALLDEVYARVG